MMRISVTTLDAFRLYMHPDNDWMTEAELLANIRGEFEPTHKVDLGFAFGQVLAEPEKYRTPGGYLAEAFYFEDAMMRPCLDMFDRRGVFEAKAIGRFGNYAVVGKADQIFGDDIRENKTTLGSFDFDKYASAYQWRFLVDLFGADAVTYHVFCLSEPKATGGVALRSIETFTLYRYRGLHQDCARLVSQFCDYVKLRGLEGVLRDNQRKADERAVLA